MTFNLYPQASIFLLGKGRVFQVSGEAGSLYQPLFLTPSVFYSNRHSLIETVANSVPNNAESLLTRELI